MASNCFLLPIACDRILADNGSSRESKMRRKNTNLIILAVVAVVFLSVVIILTGYRELGEGWALVVNPRLWEGGPQVIMGGSVWAPSLLYRTNAYPLDKQAFPEQGVDQDGGEFIEALSRDDKAVSVGCRMQYRLNSTSLPLIEKKWEADYTRRFILPLLKRVVGREASNRTAASIFRSLEDFSSSIQKGLQPKMAAAGFELIGFEVTSARPEQWPMF